MGERVLDEDRKNIVNVCKKGINVFLNGQAGTANTATLLQGYQKTKATSWVF